MCGEQRVSKYLRLIFLVSSMPFGKMTRMFSKLEFEYTDSVDMDEDEADDDSVSWLLYFVLSILSTILDDLQSTSI